jgi:hypothetical protein
MNSADILTLLPLLLIGGRAEKGRYSSEILGIRCSMLNLYGSRKSTRAAAIRIHRRAFGSFWKNSSSVFFFRSRPNQTGSAPSRLLAHGQLECNALPQPNCQDRSARANQRAVLSLGRRSPTLMSVRRLQLQTIAAAFSTRSPCFIALAMVCALLPLD